VVMGYTKGLSGGAKTLHKRGRGGAIDGCFGRVL
jgi:hypothetical protein